MSRATVKEGRITWFCDGCGKPIRSGQGWIEVDLAKAHNYRQVWKEAEDAKRAECGDFLVWRMSEMPDVHPARWRPWHRSCDPDMDMNGYWFNVERCATLGQLVHWAGHLMSKRWLKDTDFDQLLEELGTYA